MAATLHRVTGNAFVLRACAVGLCAAIAACAPSPVDATKPESGRGKIEPIATSGPTTFAWPAALRVLGDGYPTAGDTCRRLGESALTVNYLDDSAILVGCPGAAQDPAAEALVAAGGRVVGAAEGVTMISIPQGDANTGMSTTAKQ
jgi:hypothetical protein